jgi:SpoVK/Ycf46/Vps4 family AAA+-type ATPase
MLGVASEQAFRGLAEAFVATGNQDGKLSRLLLNPRSTYAARFEEFRKRLEPLRSDLPHDLADVLTLDAVAELLRVTRNSVGHPTGADVDEDTARVHLQMAALYLRKMTDLREHFERLAPLSG